MIHLALWLVSLCVVALFGLAILALIVRVLGAAAEGVQNHFGKISRRCCRHQQFRSGQLARNFRGG